MLLRPCISDVPRPPIELSRALRDDVGANRSPVIPDDVGGTAYAHLSSHRFTGARTLTLLTAAGPLSYIRGRPPWDIEVLHPQQDRQMGLSSSSLSRSQTLRSPGRREHRGLLRK